MRRVATLPMLQRSDEGVDRVTRAGKGKLTQRSDGQYDLTQPQRVRCSHPGTWCTVAWPTAATADTVVSVAAWLRAVGISDLNVLGRDLNGRIGPHNR